MQNLLKGTDIDNSLDKLISENQLDQLCNAISELIGDDQKIMIAKQVFSALTERYSKLNNADMLKVGTYVLEKISQKQYFEVEFAKTKEIVAEVYNAKGEYYMAAKLLSEIKFDSPNLKYTNDDKLSSYIKICEFYFECDDATGAEDFIWKAKALTESTTNYELKLRFEVSYARIMDSNRKFMNAAPKYHWLSKQEGVDEENLMMLLESGVICAILSSAGPERSAILSNLYNDERTKRLEINDILTKMYLGRIVTIEEIEKFENKLKKHHKALTSEGITVLEKACIEHNILAISKLYETVSYQTLVDIIKVNEQRAEKIIQNMIAENRLKAKLDQITKFIDFSDDLESYGQWTRGIHDFCSKIDRLLNKIQKS